MELSYEVKNGVLKGYIKNKLVVYRNNKKLWVSCNKKEWAIIKALLTGKVVNVLIDENLI